MRQNLLYNLLFLLFFTLLWVAVSNNSSADALKIFGGEVYGGNVRGISDGIVIFNVDCASLDTRIPEKKVAFIIFRDSCSPKLSFDSDFGGDPTGCGDQPGDAGDVTGARRYYLIVTNSKKQYALKTLSISNKTLTGKTLISSNTVSFPKSTLYSYSKPFDCYFKEYIN
jgi:hypothetical protein